MPLGVGPYAAQLRDVHTIWRQDLSALAKRPNVWLKVGGLGMPYAGFDHHFPATPPSSSVLATSWGPLIESACDAFGDDRCMFESNFPADAQTCGYATLWNAFKMITESWPDDIRARLFSGTARSVYRLSVD
jgi:predicted TIM-barrel fold metal-dependent hydrolase